MATYQKFQPFIQNVGRGVYNLHTDVLKVMLSNVAPSVANGVKADITEIAAGNGYVAGGVQVAGQSYIQAAGVAPLLGDDPVIEATGPVGPFQYAVLYSDTAANDELIGFWDHGTPQSLANGEILKVDFSQVNGILQGS